MRPAHMRFPAAWHSALPQAHMVGFSGDGQIGPVVLLTGWMHCVKPRMKLALAIGSLSCWRSWSRSGLSAGVSVPQLQHNPERRMYQAGDEDYRASPSFEPLVC